MAYRSKREEALASQDGMNYAQGCLDEGFSPEDSFLFERGLADIQFAERTGVYEEPINFDIGTPYGVNPQITAEMDARERFARTGVFDFRFNGNRRR